MAIENASIVTLAFKDFDGDVKSTSFKTAPATADGSAWDTELVTRKALGTAVKALVDGVLTEESYTFNRAFDAVAPKASSSSIQTRRQWRIVYQDNTTTRQYTQTIGTAKNDNALFKPNSTEADLTNAAWTAFKTAFEAVVRSPDGNAVTFIDAYMID